MVSRLPTPIKADPASDKPGGAGAPRNTANYLAPRHAGPKGPLHVAMAEALRSSDTLGSLMQRLHRSRQRMADISRLLPEGLQGAVQPGPLDEEGWSLLVANAAAASKLRQMLPQLAAELQIRGWPEVPIKLRIQSRR
jgi:hypothetical protein